MGLFSDRKETKRCGCNCGCGAGKDDPARSVNEGGGVKVLGSGCAKCKALEASASAALAELGMDDAIDHVTDFAQIAAYGVMSTPALVVDGTVASFGKVLSKDEAKAVIQEIRGRQ